MRSFIYKSITKTIYSVYQSIPILTKPSNTIVSHMPILKTFKSLLVQYLIQGSPVDDRPLPVVTLSSAKYNYFV